MSFLSSTATIDAILTKKGREKLASGIFNPTKFALSDDEIDYGLLSLEDGESMILDTSILEASSLGNDSNTQLKYKLIISDGQIVIPRVSVQPANSVMTVYDIFEVRLSTTEGGRDTSYSIVNNNSELTISPAVAIRELNKQTYISRSGKDYNDILNQLRALNGIYGTRSDDARPVNRLFPETYTTKPIGTDGIHKFFVFAVSPTTNTIKINISGNNTGAIADFSVTKIKTILGEEDDVAL